MQTSALVLKTEGGNDLAFFNIFDYASLGHASWGSENLLKVKTAPTLLNLRLGEPSLNLQKATLIATPASIC